MCPPYNKRPRIEETSSEEDEDDDLEMLVGMGFPEAEAMEALAANGHDFERALEKLESMRDESTKAEIEPPGTVDYSALRQVAEEMKEICTSVCSSILPPTRLAEVSAKFEEVSRRMRMELRGLSASEDKCSEPELGTDVNDDLVDNFIVYDGIGYIVEIAQDSDGKNMIRMSPSWQSSLQLPLEKLPICGYQNPDQSMVVDPMDEWKLELYHASVLPTKSQGSTESSEKNVGIVSTTTNSNCTKPVVVVPNFVDATLVEQASQALDALDEAGKMTFKEAYTSSTAEKKRDDKIAFLRFEDINAGPGFKNKDGVSSPPSARNMLNALALKLAQYATELFPERRLLVPEKFMVTIYDGQGARYVAHRDNEYIEKENGGSWMNYRSVSCILYLTKNDIEGGRLRIFHDDEEKRDEQQTPQVEHISTTTTTTATTTPAEEHISPKGGTAVFFDSKTVKHEVLPCYGRRRALTFWLLEPL